jgi:hypothetical protein
MINIPFLTLSYQYQRHIETEALEHCVKNYYTIG